MAPVGDLSDPVSPGLVEFAPSWQWKESRGLQGSKEEREGGCDTHSTSTKGEIESQEEARGI